MTKRLLYFVPALGQKIWIIGFAVIAAQGSPSTFDSDMRPILAARCVSCHSAKVRSGGLSLESQEDLVKGGKSGAVVLPGKPADSLLLTMVAGGAMPKAGPKLTAVEIESVRRWIESAETVTVSEREVLMSILGSKCFVCHGRRVQQGGLDLRSRAGMLKGGKSGPAIVPGKPDESLLVKKIASQQMPPPKLQEQFSVRGLTSDEFDKLKQWIASGAPTGDEKPARAEGAADPAIKKEDRQFWAFRPPSPPAIPKVRAASVRNPVDAFLLEKLEAKGLSFSAEAGRLPLMRRAFFDLTGLPPSPADIESYLADRRPDAYERLIDHLLDSPRYGERWARYWLDAAGYADSEGGTSADSVRPHAWRYRDYVIRALNADKPYDKFLTEQIAGDELFDYQAVKEYTPEQTDRLVATGFLRMAPDPTYSTEQNYMPERFDVIANEIEVLSSTVLGLTVGCARCHDHKFDPIPQRDYYRLSAALQSAYDPYDWRVPNLDVVGVGGKPDPALTRILPLKSADERGSVERQNAPVEKAIALMEAQLAQKAAPFREKLIEERLSKLPEAVARDLRQALGAPETGRSAVQQYLVKSFEDTLKISDKDLESRFEDYKTAATAMRKEIQAEKKKLAPVPGIRALFDMGGEPTPNYVLLRGDVRNPGTPVEPGALSVLSDGLDPFVVQKPSFASGTSGRRLALARWLTQPNNPLPARVMMNRLWQHHFGRGLVASAGNFGHTGARPSHPELLDWLATEFVKRGWSLKAMHRVIMTSAAYRQSSHPDRSQLEGDPDGSLLSRFPIQRLDGEALRDSILKVAGRLDERMFGSPDAVTSRDDGEVVAGEGKQASRRSIYLQQRRSKPLTALETFDAPQLNPNCVRRSQSSVPSQAMQMFNSDLVRESARFLAGRIIDEAGDSAPAQVERAYLTALARPATSEEIRAGAEALEGLTRAWRDKITNEAAAEPKKPKIEWMALSTFCHTLLNSAEFLYVD